MVEPTNLENIFLKFALNRKVMSDQTVCPNKYNLCWSTMRSNPQKTEASLSLNYSVSLVHHRLPIFFFFGTVGMELRCKSRSPCTANTQEQSLIFLISFHLQKKKG